MENQIRLQHQRTPSISIIRPKVYPKVDPFVFEPIDDDMARAEQSFKQCRNSKHLEELNRELEEIMGSRLTPDDQRVIAATAERLSLSRAERERSMNKTFVRDDSAEENLHDTFEDKLNFSQEASVVQEQQMTPIRKIAGIAEDLPITKSCCGIFSFKRESKAEYVLRFIVRAFHFIYLIAAHPRTQTIFKQIVKIAFDLVVALVLAGVSLLMALVSYGENYLKKRNQTRRQLAVQTSRELIQTFGPRPMKFD